MQRTRVAEGHGNGRTAAVKGIRKFNFLSRVTAIQSSWNDVGSFADTNIGSFTKQLSVSFKKHIAVPPNKNSRRRHFTEQCRFEIRIPTQWVRKSAAGCWNFEENGRHDGCGTNDTLRCVCTVALLWL